MTEEQARLADTAMSCFRFMNDVKLWEERRLRELNVSMYVYNCIGRCSPLTCLP